MAKKEVQTREKSWKTELKEIAWMIIGFVVILMGLQWFGTNIGIVRVNGNSMSPTFSDQDCLWMQTNVTAVDRGDVVLIESVELNKSLIKRVIAISGDVVELKPIKQESGEYIEQIWLNGELQEEYYTDGVIDAWAVQERRFEVPNDHVFILGDYRIDSIDSRYLENPYLEFIKVKGKIVNQAPKQFCRK